MSVIHIHRDHVLGLARAREVAWQWAEHAEAQFSMECSVLEGETSDTVEFVRSGVRGTLLVAADHFTLDATLGLLLGAFSNRIEAEIASKLDALLAQEGPRGVKAAAKTPAKKAAPRKKS